MARSKQCSGCGTTDEDDFSPSQYTLCRRCRQSRKQPNTPERLEQMRKAAFLRKYGLSWEQYLKMFADRDGQCDICSAAESRQISGKLMPLCVDHEEVDGVVIVRGLLCNNCNVAIGLLKHDLQLIKSAHQYLRKAGQQ